MSRFRLKSAPAKVTRSKGRYCVKGAAWGAPVAAVQVQVDDGPWMPANLERIQSSGREERDREERRSRGYAWRFWTFDWGTTAAGEHHIRSRAFDVEGNVQPAPEDAFLASRRTYWESNGQIARRVLIP